MLAGCEVVEGGLGMLNGVEGGKLSITGKDEACRRKREGVWTPWRRRRSARRGLGACV